MSRLLNNANGQCQNVANPFPLNIFQPTCYSPYYPCPATEQPTASSSPATQSTPAPTVSLIANPTAVESGKTSKLILSSVNTSRCAIFGPSSQKLTQGGTDGSVATPKLTHSTEFGVVCQGTASDRWATAKTTVSVNGDTGTVIPVIFPSANGAQSILQSGSGGAGGAGTSGTGTGGTGSGGGTNGEPSGTSVTPPISGHDHNGQPVSAWCDPNLPIDVFIQCLCRIDPLSCQPWRSAPRP